MIEFTENYSLDQPPELLREIRTLLAIVAELPRVTNEHQEIRADQVVL